MANPVMSFTVSHSRKKRIDHHANFVGKVAPRDVMHVYHESVARLYQNCGALKSVVLYGEYFGGWHPDANVDGVGRGIPVQQHVAYCPVHRFYAFRHFGGW